MDFLQKTAMVDVSLAHPVIANFVKVLIHHFEPVQVKIWSPENNPVHLSGELFNGFWVIKMRQDIVHHLDDPNLRCLILCFKFVHFVHHILDVYSFRTLGYVELEVVLNKASVVLKGNILGVHCIKAEIKQVVFQKKAGKFLQEGVNPLEIFQCCVVNDRLVIRVVDLHHEMVLILGHKELE